MRAFAHLGVQLIHLAYLDEFGHVGPYVSRSDRRHNDSPVFGFAGFVMPVSEVRAFGTWFFQRKRELLDFEIRRSGKHPAVWEKKGSSPVPGRQPETVPRAAQVDREAAGQDRTVGRVRVPRPHQEDDESGHARCERAVLGHAARVDRPAGRVLPRGLLSAGALPAGAGRAPPPCGAADRGGGDMYGGGAGRQLVEPPFHLESHRYQTVQAADWVAALVGRIEAFRAEPDAWPENEAFDRYFGRRLAEVQVRSGISR